jgi:hypothetical protein
VLIPYNAAIYYTDINIYTKAPDRVGIPSITNDKTVLFTTMVQSLNDKLENYNSLAINSWNNEVEVENMHIAKSVINSLNLYIVYITI